MSLSSDLEAIRTAVSSMKTYRNQAKSDIQALYNHLDQTTQAPVTMSAPGHVDKRPRRSQAEHMWMSSVPQIKAAIDNTLAPKLSTFETLLTQLCDQSGWIAAIRSEGTDWDSVRTTLGTALETVEAGSLRCDETWKGGAGDGYRTKVAAQRLALTGAHNALGKMSQGCSRMASAGEGFYTAVLMHARTVPTNVGTGSLACYVLPPLSVFTVEQPGIIAAATTSIETSKGYLLQSVNEGSSRARSRREGGTGDPDDRVSVGGDLNPWPSV